MRDLLRIRTRWLKTATLAVALGLGFAGCGGGGAMTTGETERPSPTTIEAVGPEIDGRRWLRLNRRQRIDHADDFISENPGLCPQGLEGRSLANYVSGQYETTAGGEPPSTPITEVLRSQCLAAFPSG